MLTKASKDLCVHLCWESACLVGGGGMGSFLWVRLERKKGDSDYFMCAFPLTRVDLDQ